MALKHSPLRPAFARGARSRNAVVALKLWTSVTGIGSHSGSRNAVVALKPGILSLVIEGCRGKQERRSGIETQEEAVAPLGPGGEAGTP